MVFPTEALNHTVASLFLARNHTLSLHLTWSAPALLALVAGILVLLRPKSLHLIVAAYLIVLGILGILEFNF